METKHTDHTHTATIATHHKISKRSAILMSGKHEQIYILIFEKTQALYTYSTILLRAVLQYKFFTKLLHSVFFRFIPLRQSIRA